MKFKQLLKEAYRKPSDFVNGLILYVYVIWMIKSEDVRSDLEKWIYEKNEKMKD